jgi:diaminopimelate decarboxylase
MQGVLSIDSGDRKTGRTTGPSTRPVRERYFQRFISMEKLKFLTTELAESLRQKFGTPLYVYSEQILKEQAAKALAFPNAFGLTVRYAMKASSNAAILRIFDGCGLHFDASSGWECDRAMKAGIEAKKISLSTQEMPAREDFSELHRAGIRFNACSLSQLESFGLLFPGEELGVRFNPGVGSGGTAKTNVGGPGASFGIWHESIPAVREIVARHRLRVVRIHTHIGSGSDPAVWQKATDLSLNLVRQFSEVKTLNLGGGYKVGRMSSEKSTDLQEIGAPILQKFRDLEKETGRAIHLEIEPGTFLLANSCSLLATIMDVVNTGKGGYNFLKLDTGMTEILRPALYAAQHPLVVLPRKKTDRIVSYLVVGHCCESGDLLTPAPDDAGKLHPRDLPEVERGDLCVVEGAGAYCSALSAKNYNSFPEAPEVLLREKGEAVLIRRRQTLEQIVQNEIAI